MISAPGHRAAATAGRLALLFFPFVVACADSGPRPRNVILISIDTTRADHVSAYGYRRKTTPGLDRFAESGAVFLNCTSSSSWTVPAHLTIFTGLEPSTHGLVYYKEPGKLNEGYATMASLLFERGYRTAAFTGGGFMSRRHGMDQGFETYLSIGRNLTDNIPEAERWLQTVGDAPFFLFLHGFDPHRPYAPPASFSTVFDVGYRGKWDPSVIAPGKPRPPRRLLAHAISQYDGELAYADFLLTTFLEGLRQKGLLDDTLVVVTSDHGDEFYEHGNCDHIHTLHDELVRVPLIMVGPGVPAVRVEDHVGTIDVLPTVFDLMGVETNVRFQGRSRVDSLHGDGDADDPVFSFTGQGIEPRHLASVRTDRWKLVTDATAGFPNKTCPRCADGEVEGKEVWLYDLENDPEEQENVAAQNLEVVAELKGLLEQRIRESAALRLQAVEAEPASEDQLEQLRGLGYAGD